MKKFSDLKIANMVKKMSQNSVYKAPLELTGLSFDVFSDYAASAVEIFNYIYDADVRLSCQQDGNGAVVSLSSSTGSKWEH